MSGALAFPEPPGGRPPVLALAPLVDIVLLLICFYLFVTQSFQAQSDAALDLPVMRQDAGEPAGPAELVVGVGADGALTLNGEAVAEGALEAALARARADAREAGGEVSIVLRADRGRPFGELDAAIEACRRAGFAGVGLRAEGGER